MPSFLRKVRGFFTGPYIGPMEKLLITLQSYGVNAKLADKGRPEQEIGSSRWHSDYRFMLDFTRGYSLGLIDITDGPIRWVNVMEHKVEPTTYFLYVYGIPDRSLPKVHLKAVLIRKSWFGNAIDVKWEGDDLGLRIIERLSYNDSINKAILNSQRHGINSNVEIDAVPEYSCWTITTGDVFSLELWECYVSIAGELLAVPIPGK